MSCVPQQQQEAGTGSITLLQGGKRRTLSSRKKSGSLCTVKQNPEMELNRVGKSWAQIWPLLIACALISATVLCCPIREPWCLINPCRAGLGSPQHTLQGAALWAWVGE